MIDQHKSTFAEMYYDFDRHPLTKLFVPDKTINWSQDQEQKTKTIGVSGVSVVSQHGINV